MTKTLSWADTDTTRPLSATLLHLVADALQAASKLLTQLAERQSSARAARALPLGTVEFHALYGDSGAPEGALYVDGKLVGTILGITRL